MTTNHPAPAEPADHIPGATKMPTPLAEGEAAELATLRQVARPVAIPGEAYHDDMGPVTWWRFPVEEAPWVGTPGDSDWPGYHTHFTPCPPVPAPPEERRHD